MPTRKFIALDDIRIEEISKINNLTFHLRKLEKKEFMSNESRGKSNKKQKSIKLKTEKQ